MKPPALRLSIALALASPAFAAGDHNHAHAHQPLHGGVVVGAKDMDHELVATPTAMQLYLRGHGKPVDVSRASARLTLLTGSEKQDVALSPAGDKLAATGSFQVGPGTKAVAVVTIDGKPAGTVRFVLK